jgi:hypothetical protein
MFILDLLGDSLLVGEGISPNGEMNIHSEGVQRQGC